MEPLIAEEFRNDPRVAQAMASLLAALEEHGRKLTGPRPADPQRKVAYEELIQQFNKVRGGSLYFPYLGSGIGHGPFVELADGSVKYDMISGIGVHHFGHGNPRLVAAAMEGALHDTIMQGNLQQDVAAPRMAKLLVDGAARHGTPIKHCFLTTSGAMANENALKIAFQKKAGAGRVLAFERCFTGRTLALSQITDNPHYREGMPTVLPVDYVPFFNPRQPGQSRDEAISTLRSHLLRYPGQHAVMFLEMVQGEAGYYPGDSDFFKAIVQLLKEKSIAVLVDEVQTFGRTPELFAFQYFGLDADVDIVTVGKLSQVCATLFTDEYQPRPSLVSQTFIGSSSAILAGAAVVEMLLAGDFFGPAGRNAGVQRRFMGQLESLAGRHPARVSAVAGLGGMIAFTPFDGSAEAARKCAQTLFDLGLICFVAGHDPTRLRFLPPIPAISDDDIDMACRMIESGLENVAKMD